MALGNKKPESSVAGMGAPPPPPPPPYTDPARSDGVIGSLDERLQQLQATVAALVERTTAEAAAAPAGDAEVAAASRTLKMAERTAEATVTEARDEAAKLLADARQQHDSIVATARQKAESEFASQREAAAAEAAAWETRKRELLDAFSKLDAQVNDLDGRLAEARQLIRTAIEHPGLAAVATPAVTPSAAAPGSAPAVPASKGDAEGEPEAAPEGSSTDAVATAGSNETMFGNPPSPVFSGPVGDTPPTQAFYPWSGNSDAASKEGEKAAEPIDAPAPPIQRRGLFGH